MVNEIEIDPKLDLVFERTTSIPVEKLWKGWTHPETLSKIPAIASDAGPAASRGSAQAESSSLRQ